MKYAKEQEKKQYPVAVMKLQELFTKIWAFARPVKNILEENVTTVTEAENSKKFPKKIPRPMEKLLKNLGISTLPTRKYHIREVKECDETYYLLYLYDFCTEIIYDISILAAYSKKELKEQAKRIYDLEIEF